MNTQEAGGSVATSEIGLQFLRQADILAPRDLLGLGVEIVGAGALGGSIALVLAKMGFGMGHRLHLVDFDRCERHNLNVQWFRAADVHLGNSKVEAVADLLSMVCSVDVETHNERFTGAEDRTLAPIIVLAVDSLEERRRIWTNLRAREDVRFLVDARMGPEMFEVLTFDRDRDDPDKFERSFDGTPLPLPPTCGGIAYTPIAAAGIVGSVLRAYARRQRFPRHVLMDLHNFLFEAKE